MQLTDEICEVCNEYYVVGDSIDQNEMEHHEFGLCPHCHEKGETILCNVWLLNGSKKSTILEEDYLFESSLGQHLFGPPKNEEQFGAYLSQLYGCVDLVLFPVPGEIEKYDEGIITKLFSKGYVHIIGSN